MTGEHVERQKARKKPDVISDENALWMAIECFGDIAQRLKAIEELAELSAALSRHIQSMAASAEHREHVPQIDPEDVVEEIADCSIMLCQLARIYGEQKVLKAQRLKMDRLKDLIRKELKATDEKPEA